MTVELLSLRQSLESAGVNTEGMTVHSPIYHALHMAAVRDPARFSRQRGKGGLILVNPLVVSQWLTEYRSGPGSVGKLGVVVNVGTAERKASLKHISKRVGANSLSELIRWIADDVLIVGRPEGAKE